MSVEVAKKDSEIARLRQDLKECELEVALRGARCVKMENEIAALREAIRWASVWFTSEDLAYEKDKMPDHVRPSVRRALKRS